MQRGRCHRARSRSHLELCGPGPFPGGQQVSILFLNQAGHHHEVAAQHLPCARAAALRCQAGMHLSR